MIESPATHRDCHRLHAAAEFAAVFDHRRVLRGEHFALHFRPNGGANARLGLVVAKKLASRAVLRNLVKRLGREAFRQARGGLPACDLVLRLTRALPADTPAARAAWRREIDGLLMQLPRQDR